MMGKGDRGANGVVCLFGVLAAAVFLIGATGIPGQGYQKANASDFGVTRDTQLDRGPADPVSIETEGATVDPQAHAAVQQFMSGSSVFIKNEGQWPDDSIAFALDGSGANVGLTDAGPRFQLFRAMTAPTSSLAPSDPNQVLSEGATTAMREFGVVFDGAARVTPTGHDQAARTFNYLRGDVALHREGVPSYASVWYEDLYPGVNLELTGNRSGIKYNFHIAPGADWRTIRVRYDGIQGLSLRPDGALEIRIADGWGILTDAVPYIYQEVNGANVEVPGRFVLLDDRTCGFEITGNYDSALPLTIDPVVDWGSYLGGTLQDEANDVAVDASGNVYVAGHTQSSGWVSGGWDTVLDGTQDACVVKLDPTGGHLWSTYVGGADFERGWGIAVDGDGNTYITGETYSAGWVSGGWDTSYGGGGDGFLVKLATDGTYAWSTYLGDTNYEVGYSIAVDPNGNVYVTGETQSSGWVSGGWDTTYAGVGRDGFVVKLDATGSHVWSTYLGAIGNEYGYGITVDGVGNVFATGSTGSSGWVSGGGDTTFNGGTDIYVVDLRQLALTCGPPTWAEVLTTTVAA